MNSELEIVKGEELSTKVDHDLQRIDIRKELPLYRMPSLELLDEYSSQRHEVSEEELYRNNNKICATLTQNICKETGSKMLLVVLHVIREPKFVASIGLTTSLLRLASFRPPIEEKLN